MTSNCTADEVSWSSVFPRYRHRKSGWILSPLADSGAELGTIEDWLSEIKMSKGRSGSVCVCAGVSSTYPMSHWCQPVTTSHQDDVTGIMHVWCKPGFFCVKWTMINKENGISYFRGQHPVRFLRTHWNVFEGKKKIKNIKVCKW